MLLEPRKALVYGPVRSRRLGRSLGVNLFPGGRKTCSFDCRYCQYGCADPVTAAPKIAGSVRAPEDVAREVERALEASVEPPEWITFSGNGEPTLHPAFPEIVDRIIALRDRALPGVRIAVLSNSSRLAGETRRALSSVDARIMKLDVGTEAGLRCFNRPVAAATLASIVDGLARLGGVTIQALFAGGPSGNLDDGEVAAWLHALVRIRPIGVQLYSLDREAPDAGLTRASPAALESIRARLSACGLRAAVF